MKELKPEANPHRKLILIAVLVLAILIAVPYSNINFNKLADTYARIYFPLILMEKLSVQESIVPKEMHEIFISDPQDNLTLKNRITISASSSDLNLSSIGIYVDEINVATCFSSPCIYNGYFSAGNHSYYAVLQAAGKLITSRKNSFLIMQNGQDLSQPSIYVTQSPENPTTKKNVIITADASDNVGISKITIYVDDIAVMTCYTSTCIYSKSEWSFGNHTFYAVARDTSGNEARTATKSFIAKTKPVIGTEQPSSGPPPSQPTNRNPSALIRAVPESGSAPLEVNFSSLSSDPDGDALSCSWNFGDLQIASQCSVNHTYENPGEYIATLTVADLHGGRDSDVILIKVLYVDRISPAVDVVHSPASPYTGEPLTITATASDNDQVASIDIFIDDVNVKTCGFTPCAYTTTFQDAGSHVYNASAGDPTGNRGASLLKDFTVVQNNPPDGNIISPASDETIFEGQSINFQSQASDPDGHDVSYLWDFDGAAADSNIQNPGSIVFSTPGTYTVTLIVSDVLGLADPTPDSRVIHVNPLDLTAPSISNVAVSSITHSSATISWDTDEASTSLVFYRNSTGNFQKTDSPGTTHYVYLTDLSPSTMYYFAVNSSDVYGNTNQSDEQQFATPSKPAEIAICSDTDSDTYPTINPDMNGTLRIRGDGTYLDTCLDAYTLKEVYCFTKNDFTPSYATITCNDGCRPEARCNKKPSAEISASAVSGMAPLSVDFSSLSSDPDGDTLACTWDFDNGQSSFCSATHVFTNGGEFLVNLTVDDGYGGINSTNVTINVIANQAPNGIINEPNDMVIISAGQGVYFSGTGTDPDNNLPLSYLWDFGGGAANTNIEDPGYVVFNTPGIFNVYFTVTDSLGLADPSPDTRVVIVTSNIIKSSGLKNGNSFYGAWANSVGAKYSDSSYASTDVWSGRTAQELFVKNFSFTIPSASIITGIEARILYYQQSECKDGTRSFQPIPGIVDDKIRLLSTGLQSTNYARAVLPGDEGWPLSDNWYYYGGSTDLWGVKWTSEQVNNESFGIMIVPKFNAPGCAFATAYINQVLITVYYKDVTMPQPLMLRSSGNENIIEIILSYFRDTIEKIL